MELNYTQEINYNKTDWFEQTRETDPAPRKRLNIKCKIKMDPADMEPFRYVEKETKDGLKKSWIWHTIIPKDQERCVLFRPYGTRYDGIEVYCPNCLADVSACVHGQEPNEFNNWTPYTVSPALCPVCGQALSDRVHEYSCKDEYVSNGVSVIGPKIQLWHRVTEMKMESHGKGLATRRFVTILTINTRTRQSYVTLLKNKKKTVRKAIYIKPNRVLDVYQEMAPISSVLIEQFRLLTGIQLNDVNDIVLVNATREDVSWSGIHCMEEYGGLPKNLLRPITRHLNHFDQSKTKLAKAMYPHVKKNITLLTYSELLPDNQRKLFEACSSRSLLIRQYKWDEFQADVEVYEEAAPYVRERIYLYAVGLVKLVNKNETVAVNRIIKWINECPETSEFVTLFQDTFNSLDQLKYKKVDWSTCVAKTLRETHDLAWKLNSKIRTPNQKIPYTKEEEQYEMYLRDIQFHLPKDTHTLFDVGSEMHICVGSYGHFAVQKSCTIVVGYVDNKPGVCIELNHGSIVQAKLFGNERPAGETRKTILQWAALCDLKLDTNDLDKYDVNPTTGEIIFDENN